MADKKFSAKIQLTVPNELYYAIKRLADYDTITTGEKKTIADKMVELLRKQVKPIDL